MLILNELFGKLAASDPAQWLRAADNAINVIYLIYVRYGWKTIDFFWLEVTVVSPLAGTPQPLRIGPDLRP